jgi:hypothetical protein
MRFGDSIVFASQGVGSKGEATSELWMADGTPDGFRRLYSGNANIFSAVPVFATEGSVYTKLEYYVQTPGSVWRTFGERYVTSPFKAHADGLGPLQVSSFVGAEGENVIIAAGTQLWFVDMGQSRPGSGGGCTIGGAPPIVALVPPLLWRLRRSRQERVRGR